MHLYYNKILLFYYLTAKKPKTLHGFGFCTVYYKF